MTSLRPTLEVMSEHATGDEIRDELPADLNVSEFVGAYQFPDNSRRRIPGYIYLVVAVGCLVGYLLRDDESVFLNRGLLLAAGLLGAVGVAVAHLGLADDRRRAAGAGCGPARWSTSRSGMPRPSRSGAGCAAGPTWRVLAYSAEEPPKRRAFVLVDAIDGRTLEHIVEDNPEDLSEWADT